MLADDVEGPPWAERVAPGGDEHLARLEEARYVVANNLVPRFAKRADAVFVQTWHGTPFKRIGFDLPDAEPGYLDHLGHERALWDLLVSPGAAATPRLRSAFRYEGRVIETGYPRNDALASAPARRVERPRTVLYAPTFREAGRFDLRLDPGALADALDADVLLRLHHFAPHASFSAHPRVRDVTREPDDIRDLLLAADALVTDYSSVLADFAITGRPIVLFADDIDPDRLYAPLPWPVLDSTEAVAAALAAGPAGYADFRRTYCALEDGGAADRVIDAMLAA